MLATCLPDAEEIDIAPNMEELLQPNCKVLRLGREIAWPGSARDFLSIAGGYKLTPDQFTVDRYTVQHILSHLSVLKFLQVEVKSNGQVNSSLRYHSNESVTAQSYVANSLLYCNRNDSWDVSQKCHGSLLVEIKSLKLILKSSSF